MNNKQALWLILAMIVAGGATLAYNTWYKQQLARDTSDSQAGQTLAAAPQVGKQRPDFTLKDLIGVPRDINEWDGKIIVLNFWATWCRPCLREIPMFTEVQSAMADQDVQFVGIAVDDRAAVETFMERTGTRINFPVLIGNDDAIPVAVEYGNETGILPYTVFIDTDGTLKYSHFGSISREELEDMLRKLINKTA